MGQLVEVRVLSAAPILKIRLSKLPGFRILQAHRIAPVRDIPQREDRLLFSDFDETCFMDQHHSMTQVAYSISILL